MGLKPLLPATIPENTGDVIFDETLRSIFEAVALYSHEILTANNQYSNSIVPAQPWVTPFRYSPAFNDVIPAKFQGRKMPSKLSFNGAGLARVR